MDRKSASRTNVFQINSFSRHTLGLAYKVNSAALVLVGRGELFSLAFPIPFCLSCRQKESKTHMWSPGWGRRGRFCRDWCKDAVVL